MWRCNTDLSPISHPPLDHGAHRQARAAADRSRVNLSTDASAFPRARHSPLRHRRGSALLLPIADALLYPRLRRQLALPYMQCAMTFHLYACIAASTTTPAANLAVSSPSSRSGVGLSLRSYRFPSAVQAHQRPRTLSPPHCTCRRVPACTPPLLRKQSFLSGRWRLCRCALYATYQEVSYPCFCEIPQSVCSSRCLLIRAPRAYSAPSTFT